MIKNKFDHYYRTTKGESKLKNAIMSHKKFQRIEQAIISNKYWKLHQLLNSLEFHSS